MGIIFKQVVQGSQPDGAVRIGEGDAVGHLIDVFLRMEIIPIIKIPPGELSQFDAQGGLPAS